MFSIKSDCMRFLAATDATEDRLPSPAGFWLGSPGMLQLRWVQPTPSPPSSPAFLPRFKPGIPSSSRKKTLSSYIPLSPPSSLSQGQHPGPTPCTSLPAQGRWPSALLQFFHLDEILGLEFVFLPAGNAGGWDGRGSRQPQLLARQAGATPVARCESGLSHASTSYWDPKVVLLTAENGF